ncbi:hypothetical protein P4114_15905 [Pseudomonas aeruginosa]|nr:hypothetical protein [Pseudomonas aeruginosa]MDF5978926.1 hypothetical protein [Pseudomonas aeruginosa]
MKDLSLHQAAQRLGLSRPELIKRMKAAGLLDSSNLPAVPVRDRLYLRAKETPWHHPELGMQYSHSTKVRPAGVAWLADKLGIPASAPQRTAARLADEPRPREYARQIVALRTIEERRAALERVPEHLRELVRTHVEIAWNHPKGNK